VTDLYLVRESSGDQVARHIRSLIVNGTLRRGDRVPQDEIAAALGVSRIPVREALVALDREGWVTLQMHHGAFVHGIDEPWVQDHYALLAALFGLGAQRAAIRGTEPEVDQLRALQRELNREPDIAAFEERNLRVLEQLFTMARSSRLTAARRAVTGVLSGNFFAQVPGTIEPHRRGIAATVCAVAARDDGIARQRLEAVIAQHGLGVVKLLRHRGVLAG
jgi:DNA-binding GntR family transcriptional regulator